MLDVLLVRIQPTDRQFDDLEYFPNDKPLAFDISVSNGNRLELRASKKYYFDPESSRRDKSPFYEKVQEVKKELGLSSGGGVVAIDKYPFSQFEDGVKEYEEQDSNILYSALLISDFWYLFFKPTWFQRSTSNFRWIREDIRAK